MIPLPSWNGISSFSMEKAIEKALSRTVNVVSLAETPRLKMKSIQQDSSLHSSLFSSLTFPWCSWNTGSSQTHTVYTYTWTHNHTRTTTHTRTQPNTHARELTCKYTHTDTRPHRSGQTPRPLTLLPHDVSGFDLLLLLQHPSFWRQQKGLIRWRS